MINKTLSNQCWYLHFVSTLALSAVIASCFDSALAQSKIVPDTTLGAESSGIVPLDVSGLPIDVIDGGALRGVKLFHSFTEFNIAEPRAGYFLNPSNDIQNILARVTGNNRSEILGTLGILNATGVTSNPNLFLMNPNGIIFGKDASLDVGGSFVATTANAVELGSTGLFRYQHQLLVLDLEET
jgi:filamentous hemagglutinin family protein